MKKKSPKKKSSAEAPPPVRGRSVGRLQPSPEIIRAHKALAAARKAAEEGETERALELFQNVLAHSPHNTVALAGCFAALRALRRFDEVLAMFQDLPPRLRETDSMVYQLALTHHEKGESEQALKTLAPVLPPETRFAAGRYLQARALAALGDEAAAVASLQQAVDQGFFKVGRVERQPEFARLRDNAEFRELVNALSVKQRKRPLIESEGFGTPKEKLRPNPELHPEATPLEIIKELRQNYSTGRQVPVKIDLLDLHGKPLRSSSYKGKTLAIVVWGSWSVRSQRVLQVMQQLARDMKDDDVAVIALAWEIVHESADADPESARLGALAKLKELKVTLPCALADSRVLSSLYVSGCPTVAFVTADGIMRTQTRGDYPLNVMKGTIREVKRIGKLADAARRRGDTPDRGKYNTILAPQKKGAGESKPSETTVKGTDRLNLIRGPANGQTNDPKDGAKGNQD